MHRSQKIIIAGSRTINDYTVLLSAIESLKRFVVIDHNTEIISGGAFGVDTLARRYAYENHLKLHELKPQYKGPNDRGAPLRRNAEMALLGDVLLAVWDGTSTGTQNMISCMEQLGKPVYIFKSN